MVCRDYRGHLHMTYSYIWSDPAADCEPLTNDGVALVMPCRGGATLRAPANKPVRLRFERKDVAFTPSATSFPSEGCFTQSGRNTTGRSPGKTAGAAVAP